MSGEESLDLRLLTILPSIADQSTAAKATPDSEFDSVLGVGIVR
jgi:hypothetical protein